MKPSTFEATRANAMRIELSSRPEIDIDEKPEQWPTMTLERSIDEYAVHEFAMHESGEIEPLQSTKYDDPATAWTWLHNGKSEDHYGVGVFIGPGGNAITLETPVMLPNHWRVYFIDRNSQPHIVGDYLHRLSAMAVVKAIVESGLCPIVITPYMVLDHEWNADHVLMSSEVSEALRRALR